MNYGYASLENDNTDGDFLTINDNDFRDEIYPLQLYFYAATCKPKIIFWSKFLVHNRIDDLERLNILDVSCGRGNGIYYIAKYLNPEISVGVDISHS